MPTSHLEQAERLIDYVRSNRVLTVSLKADRWTSWDVDVFVNTRFVMTVSNVATDLAKARLRKDNVVFINI